MSARTQMVRKLDGGRKPKADRLYVKGDYPRWAAGLQSRLTSLFDWERYLKHAAHSKNMIRSINEDRARRAT